MDDVTLTKVSLVAALVGIGGLLAVSQLLQPDMLRIADISSSDAGKIVTVEGRLSGLAERNGNYFLTVDDGSQIKAVIFESGARRIPEAARLSKNDKVSVTGQVALYKGELEIIVQALNVLSN